MTLLLLFVLQSTVANPQSEMSLGDSLLRHGFNIEAAREFRRSLYSSDSGSVADDLTRLKLGLSLAASDDLPAAAEELRAAAGVSAELAEPAQTALAGFYASRGRYDLARFELSDLLVFTGDSVRRASLHSAIGWLDLQEGDLSSAASSYGQAGRPEVASALSSAGHRPRRSPTAAAVLSSIIPGSGEVYAGRPATGLLAFAVTAGSVVWAVVAARSDDWVSASVIVSALFWRVYNGSRANAVAFADEYNSAARRRRIASLSSHVTEPDWYGQADSLLGYKVRPDTVRVDSLSGLR